MDDGWLADAMDWAVGQFDELPSVNEAQLMIQSDDPAAKARASLILATQSYLTEHGVRAARWQVANACNTFAGEAGRSGDTGSQRDWLVVAALLYSDLAATDDSFSNSLAWTSGRLRDLGIEDWRAHDPVRPPELSGGQEYEQLATERNGTGGPRHVRPELQTDIDLETGVDQGIENLVAGWTGSLPLDTAIAEFADYLSSVLRTVPIVEYGLAEVLAEDFSFIRQLVAEAGIPPIGDDALQRAKEARNLANAGAVKVATEPYVRRRWLLAALVNYTLWKRVDWHTNRPQVTWDILGYVTTIQIARRFNDSERELLLALQELVVRLGATMPVAYLRFPQLPNWILSALGTYLLTGGPQPVVPSESLTDPRVHGERRTETGPGTGFFGPGREDRHRWPRVLLGQWRYDSGLCSSAAFALASVSGWDESTIIWLVRLIFETALAQSAAPDDRDFWIGQALEIFGRAQPIRIASNPWAPTESEPNRSHSFVTSDAQGRLTVPSPVLRAMVAQLTDDDWSTTVQGEIFRGRRVPTYLLVNQYGPFGILKLDFADRVAREVKNFEHYARRLRPQYRPSECRRGEYQLFVGDHPEPLQAILTTYVFEDQDGPKTFKSWLATADPARVVDFLSQLADNVLYPWLSHVSRRPIDLRMAY
ncbi:MAG: hypothetical protein QOG85_1714, partial [Gaiellaceae bacterium]|nr:hypothetical protein [Gaiellaceae bacterium]